MQALLTPDSSVVTAVFQQGKFLAYFLNDDPSTALLYNMEDASTAETYFADTRQGSAGSVYNTVKKHFGPGSKWDSYELWNHFAIMDANEQSNNKELGAMTAGRLQMAVKLLNDQKDQTVPEQVVVHLLETVLRQGNE